MHIASWTAWVWVRKPHDCTTIPHMKQSLRWSEEDREGLERLLWRISYRYEIEELLTRHYGCYREQEEWLNPQLDGRYQFTFLDGKLASVLFITGQSV